MRSSRWPQLFCCAMLTLCSGFDLEQVDQLVDQTVFVDQKIFDQIIVEQEDDKPIDLPMCLYDFANAAAYTTFGLATSGLVSNDNAKVNKGDVNQAIGLYLGALRYFISAASECTTKPDNRSRSMACVSGMTMVAQSVSRASEAVLRSIERCPANAEKVVNCHTTEKVLEDMHSVLEPMIRMPQKPTVMGHYEAMNMLLRMGLRFSSGCSGAGELEADPDKLIKKEPWMPALCAAEALSLSWAFNEIAGASSEAIRTCGKELRLCDAAPHIAAGFRAGGGIAGLLKRKALPEAAAETEAEKAVRLECPEALIAEHCRKNNDNLTPEAFQALENDCKQQNQDQSKAASKALYSEAKRKNDDLENNPVGEIKLRQTTADEEFSRELLADSVNTAAATERYLQTGGNLRRKKEILAEAAAKKEATEKNEANI